MNLKTELAPKGLAFRSSDFVMSDKYCTILTVISYPRLIGEGYLSSLTSMVICPSIGVNLTALLMQLVSI